MLWKWGRESTWVREEKEASQRQRSVFAVETEWGGDLGMAWVKKKEMLGEGLVCKGAWHVGKRSLSIGMKSRVFGGEAKTAE